MKQAAGKVRCGGCGSAFNALEYLSEKMPEQPAAKEPEPSLPELTPEPLSDEPKIPQTVSAEQSAALLKTLDELAGADIRIEDTGIEWRVVDEDDETAEAAIDENEPGMFDTHVTTVDELLDESPTPVDQFLTATPNDIEAAEIFEASENGPAITPVDELRFDDNTPLPEDFGLDDESPYVPEARPAIEPELETSTQQPEPQTDLELSDPDEWTDILDEFEVLSEPSPLPLAAELDALKVEVAAAATEDAGAGPEEAEPADEILDVDTQFALQAEAMGIDLSGMHQSPPVDDVEMSEPADADASAPDEVDADQDVETADAAETAEGDAEEPAAIAEEPAAIAEEPAAIAEEPAAIAEEPDEAVAASDETEPEEDVEQLELIEAERSAEGEPAEDEAPLEFGKIEREIAELEEQSNVFAEDYFDSTGEASDEDAAESETESERDALEGIDEFEFDEDLALEEHPELKTELDLKAEPYPEDELELDGESSPAEDEQADSADAGTRDEPIVPPMTEEEQTINMMIDQDLMSLAIEDEDGFASTIIIPDKDAEAKAGKKDKRKRKDKKKKKDKKEKKKPAVESEATGFETIIMEGEFVRTALDREKFESQAAEAAALVEQAKAAEAAVASQSRGRRMSLIGGIAALVLLLLIQGVHQWRDTLATIPAINSVISPIYRLLGKPLTPSWDVRGWRFEATREVLGEDSSALTIYSRIGNKSEKSLPYPLINIALTDRFEETIGSRMLDPAEYLASGLDPGQFVAPGENFEAVMSIRSPSADATGYKLKPCYRVSGGQLRCHIPDFK